jgi:hypothetical protein
MEHELSYPLRPREMRDRHGRGSAKGNPDVRRAKRARRLIRANAQPQLNKLIERGLNGDRCGGALAARVADLAARVDRKLHPILRRTLHAVDREGSLLLTKYELMRAIGFAVAHHDRWIRKPAQWWPQPQKKDVGQLASLLRHLFCRYRVPTPFVRAWMSDDDNVYCTRGREWYIHIGQGSSLRHAHGLPFPLSRAAAHAVMNAPDDLTLSQAMRYGQFVAMGVSEALATAAARTQLGRPNADDAAAVVMARFLAHNADTRVRDVQQMVDYLVARRRGFHDFAAQPNFTLGGGRTARTLMWEIRLWQQEINRLRNTAGQPLFWSSCGIGGFEQIVIDANFDVTRWRIVELTSSAQLAAEGRAMHHCVATFSPSASRGECAIFALRRDDGNGGGTKHIATIEVELPGRVVGQVQGPCNQRVTASVMEKIARWAAVAGVDLGWWGRA